MDVWCRFRQKSDILPQIVAEIFPILVSIATQMLQTPPSASQEIPTMLHLILKTYKTSIVINLSANQQSSESLVPWGQLLFAVVNLQIPKEVVSVNEEERERSEWWKTKKWAYGILCRLFHRFAFLSLLIAHHLIDISGSGSGTLPNFLVLCRKTMERLPSIS